MDKDITIIAAVDLCFGIADSNGIPWKVKSDMSRFKKITTKCAVGKQNAVIMGRRTWDSLNRPLPNRINIVVSNNIYIDSEYAVTVHSFNDALQFISSNSDTIDKIFAIGGVGIYKEAMKNRNCREIKLTIIRRVFDCTRFFPSNMMECGFKRAQQSKILSENDLEYQFIDFRRKEHTQHQEIQYINLVSKIMYMGITKKDRTGVGTISVFGEQMRFSLKNNSIPLLTTKRVFWRGIVEELLWFISGDTNAKTLQKKNIHFWDGNSSREYLDKIGLENRRVGDLGPVYGFQWRHFGAKYVDMYTNYDGKGIDQLADVINKLKTNPDDRRIVLTAWNPSDIYQMALPPCHMFCQFYVANKQLSCQLYQRSGDMGLGIPFNIASYALFTHMLAHVTGLQAYELIHTIGDAHIYINHVDALKEQIKRKPLEFPTVHLNPSVRDINKFRIEDIHLKNYKSHKGIQMDMAV